MLKLYFTDTICHNSDMFRPIVICFRELLNLHKAYKNTDGLLNTLKFVQKVFIGIINLVCSSAEVVHKLLKLWFTMVHIRWMWSLCCGSKYGTGLANNVETYKTTTSEF
jgi:hypothetical protein